MLPPPEAVNEVELPLLTELDKALGLDVFVLVGEVPLIGVMLPELLGVVMPALEALLLLGLLLRGVNSPPDTVEEDEPRGFPAVSSRGVIEEFWFFERPFRIPMLDSARPPAYDGLLLQQLQPVKKMPRLHAPMRPAKGILPIVLSSPV